MWNSNFAELKIDRLNPTTSLNWRMEMIFSELKMLLLDGLQARLNFFWIQYGFLSIENAFFEFKLIFWIEDVFLSSKDGFVWIEDEFLWIGYGFLCIVDGFLWIEDGLQARPTRQRIQISQQLGKRPTWGVQLTYMMMLMMKVMMMEMMVMVSKARCLHLVSAVHLRPHFTPLH